VSVWGLNFNPANHFLITPQSLTLSHNTRTHALSINPKEQDPLTLMSIVQLLRLGLMHKRYFQKEEEKLKNHCSSSTSQNTIAYTDSYCFLLICQKIITPKWKTKSQ
jgi:low temperature requirement protein LtrA